MKRKTVEEDTLEDSFAKPNQSQLNQTITRNHRSEVSYENSGARKSNSRKELPNHGKKYYVSWESRKWPLKAASDSPLVKNNSFSCLGGFTFGAKAQENEYTSRERGNFSEGKGDTYWRQNDRRDSKGPNGHYGLVRGRGLGSLEEHLPLDRGECSTGLPSHGGRSMGQNSKPILAFPYGQAKISPSNQHSLGATRKSLLEIPLRRINKCLGDDPSGASDLSEKNPSRETGGDGSHGQSIPSEASAVLNANDSMHSEHPKQPVSIWNPEAGNESISWTHQGKDCTEASMDIEGDRGGTIPDMV